MVYKSVRSAYKKANHSWFLTPKIMYIAVNAQYFIFYNFRQIFLKSSKGFTDKQYAYAFSATQFLTFFSNMWVAYLADKHQKPRTILIACLVLSACIFQLFYAQVTSPLFFSIVLVIYSTFILSAPPLLDRIVLDYLQNTMHAPSSLYGRQRLFGTLSYVMTTYAVESLVYLGQKEPRFGILAPMMMIGCAVAVGLVSTLAPADRERSARVTSSSERVQIGKLFGQTAFLYFLVVIFLNGLTRGVMTSYLSYYQRTILKLGDLKAPSSIPGFIRWIVQPLYSCSVSTCSGFGVLLEIAILFYSKPLLRKMGLHWPLLLSQVAQGLRFLAYTYIKPTDRFRFEACCMVEMLKGVNFGLTHISGVQLAVRLVPPNLKATSQMVYAGTFVGLGGVFGTLLGILFKIDTVKGFEKFFQLCAAFSALAVSLIFVKYGLIDKKLGKNREFVEEESRPKAQPAGEPTQRMPASSLPAPRDTRSSLLTDSTAD